MPTETRRWERFSKMLVLVLIPVLAVNVTPLHSASSVMIPASILQEPLSDIHQLVLSPNISVSSIYALGSGRTFFNINSSNFMIFNTVMVPPGSYSLDIVIHDGNTNSLVYVFVTINVMPEADQACDLQLFGKCSQFCTLDTSTYGYSCSCAEGYILQQDSVTCLTFEPLPSLLVASGNGVAQLNLLTRQPSPISLSGSVDYFDYLYVNQTIFYADNSQHVINTVSFGGKEEQVLYNYSQESLTGLAVDWVNEVVLYSTNDTIRQVDIQTKQSTVVHTALSQPRSLVLYINSEQRVLLWIETESGSHSIMRSHLDGSLPQSVNTSTTELVDLSVDGVTQELYWATADGHVCVSDFSGTAVRCHQCCGGAPPNGIAVFEVFVYVSLKSNNRVIQVPKFALDNSIDMVAYESIAHPSQLVIVHPLSQPLPLQGVSDCSECEQLCVLGAASVSCDCSPGFRLGSNRHSCHVDEVSDLVLAQSERIGEATLNTVSRISPTGRELERLVDTSFGPQLTPKTGLIYAMDYDRENNVVFYGDRTSTSIWRVSLNREQPSQDDRQLLVSGALAWDIVFDWLDSTLYWTDDRSGSIHSVSISNGIVVGAMATIISDRSNIRGLALNPLSRYIYWAESGAIWRYNLESLSPEVLVSGLVEPSGLVIDHQSNTLYWTELSGRIGQISLDGSDQEEIYNNPSAAPFKIALYREYLLWISNQSDAVNVIDRESVSMRGSITIVPASSSRRLTGLLVVGSNRQQSRGQYQCVQNTPGCSHYCTTDEEDKAVCSCPPGYSLASGNTCTFSGECPVCTGGGSCVVMGSEITCSCPPGLMGRACDQDCPMGTFGEGCSQMCTCLNGGVCNPVNGSCNCTDGYEGVNCEQAICTEECQNGGTCVEPDVCSCIPTYGGPTCLLRVCTSDFCRNGGTCVEDFGRELSCSCPESVSGPQCQFEDVFFFPQRGDQLAMQIGAPIGVLFGLAVVLIVVGIGVFYYVRCIPHRKTNPLESQGDTPLKDLCSPDPESTAGTVVSNEVTLTTKNLKGRDSENVNHENHYIQR